MDMVKYLCVSKCDTPLSEPYSIELTSNFNKDMAEMKMWHCH